MIVCIFFADFFMFFWGGRANIFMNDLFPMNL